MVVARQQTGLHGQPSSKNRSNAALGHNGPRSTQQHMTVLSSNGTLELEAHELVDLSRKLEGQLVEDLSAETADDHAHGGLRIDAALLKVKELVLADLAGGGLVLHLGRGLPHLKTRGWHGGCVRCLAVGMPRNMDNQRGKQHHARAHITLLRIVP